MVAFLSSRGAGGGASAAAAVPAGTGERPRGRVYVVPAFSGEAEALTGAQEGVSAFAWSPGSGRIAYLARVPLSDDEEKNQTEPCHHLDKKKRETACLGNTSGPPTREDPVHQGPRRQE